jgi:hypothetical protein
MGLLPESVKLVLAGSFLLLAIGGLGFAWLMRQDKIDAAQGEEQGLETEPSFSPESIRVAIQPMGGAYEVMGRRVVEDAVLLPRLWSLQIARWFRRMRPARFV